jgi:EmrB/QacA subfamily drug resistance transporter
MNLKRTTDKNEASPGAALLVATLSSFIAPFVSSTAVVALPAIGKQFALDAITLNWVSTSTLLAGAMFLVPFGRIADIHGMKRIFTWGVVIFTLASLFAAISPSAAFLLAFRAVQGIGNGMIFGTGTAILTSVVPASERGRALGINAAAVYVGLSIGPPVGGVLTQYFGWRSIFIAVLPVGLATLVAVLWKLKGEWREARGEKLDLTGSIVYALALVALMYGLSVLPGIEGLLLIVIGGLGIVAFLWWETRAKSPVLSINFFRHNSAFAFSNFAALLNYMAVYAVSFLLSLYLQYIKGFNPRYTGLILISEPVVMAVLSPVTGRLSDRVEPGVLASIGMALSTAGLILMAFLGPDTGLWLILLSLVIVGLGFALFSSPNTNAVMSSVDRKSYGVASGMLATMRLIGQNLSMGITILLFALVMGRVQITPEYYPLFLKSMQIIFIISAVLCFGGVFASLARGRTRN